MLGHVILFGIRRLFVVSDIVNLDTLRSAVTFLCHFQNAAVYSTANVVVTEPPGTFGFEASSKRSGSMRV